MLSRFICFSFLPFIFFSISAQGALYINEFMAGNDSVEVDPQGDYDDWIEIYNSSAGSVDLSGMYLTDDLEDKTAWQFPVGTEISGNAYLLVWADKDVEDNPDGLHANFKLSKSGEAIGLYAADGESLIDSITFGAQSDDVSYGRYPDGSNNWYFFDSNPSPLTENVAAATSEVVFSSAGGPFSQAFTLFLSAAANASIVYTTDGSIPSYTLGSDGGLDTVQAGTTSIYDTNTGIPIDRSASAIIRAISIEPGKLPSRIKTESYLAVSNALASFSSNIPVVIIETFNNQIPPKTWVNGTWVNSDPIASYATFYDTDTDSGMASIGSDLPNHSGRIGINVRGQSSSELPKRPYKVETWDENDEDIDVPLLGFPSESDWVFSNPFTDRTFMRTVMAFEMSERMGHYSPRTKFVEVFINEDGGQIGGPDSDDYQGVYVLMESIKRGDDRVDIEKLESTDDSSSSDDSSSDITNGPGGPGRPRGSNDIPVNPQSALVGDWTVTFLGIGPDKDTTNWWSLGGTELISQRPEYADDTYTFNADGSFTQNFQGVTYVEWWQDYLENGTRTPVAPHDGSSDASWSYDSVNETITLNGLGAFIALPKAVNGYELNDFNSWYNDFPQSRTYDLTNITEAQMILNIDVGVGFWTFILQKSGSETSEGSNGDTEVVDADPPDLSGGYIIKHDKNRDEDDFTTWSGRWFYVEPSDREITEGQKLFIQSDILEFEGVLRGDNFDDPASGYRQYIDVDSFIDNDFVSEITKEVDTYRFSTFVTKNRNGKLEMSPQWDFNLSMGNNDYNIYNIPDQHYTSGWSRDFNHRNTIEYRWHERLMEDSEYLLQYADRWFHHRETVLSDSEINDSIDQKLALLSEAAERNFNRWDVLNNYSGFAWAPWHTFFSTGNPNIEGSDEGEHTYAIQVDWFKNWLTGEGTPSGPAKEIFYSSTYSDRLGWIDSNIQNRTGFFEPPVFKINNSEANAGALFNNGDQLSILTDTVGTVYYTLDGSDPRELFTDNALGTVYGTTEMHLVDTLVVNADSQIKYLIPSEAIADWASSDFDDASWSDGVNGLGYENSGTDYASLIQSDVSEMYDANGSVYMRVPFALSDLGALTSMVLKMKYDDAFIAYINGVEVARSLHAPTNANWDSLATGYNDDADAVVFEDFSINLASDLALIDGTNILAIHCLNHGAASTDLLALPVLELTKEVVLPDDLSNAIALNKTLMVKSRVKSDTSWSALNTAIFADSTVKDNLRITELMYHPEVDGEEYIELRNIGTVPISLYLCEFTDGIDFVFPDMILQPSEYVLVVEDQIAFESKYGTGYNIAGEFANGTGLSNGGEEIVLRDAARREIHDFDYYDTITATDGNGYSLTIIDENDANLENWDMDDFDGWTTSANLGGSPGQENYIEPLSITIEQNNGGLYLEWTGDGVIKSTDSLDGTWNLEEGISSPHLLDTNLGTKKFYKID